MTLRKREQHRRWLADLMETHNLSKQEIAAMLHSSESAVVSWMKPETSKSSNPVPMWAMELLEFKLGLRKAERR